MLQPTKVLPALAKPRLQTTAVIKLNVVAKCVPAEWSGTNEIHGYFCMSQETQKVGNGRVEYLTFQRWWSVKMHTLQEIFVLDK